MQYLEQFKCCYHSPSFQLIIIPIHHVMNGIFVLAFNSYSASRDN